MTNDYDDEDREPARPGYVYDDGGRIGAGFKALADDCVCRSIVIVTGRPYEEVYARLADGNANQRVTKHSRKYRAGVRSASRRINTKRKWFRDYMAELGLRWTPTMAIGSGTTVHLSADELPKGRIVVAVSGHYTAMIDGVIHDLFDPRRSDGGRETRAVYGYWTAG